MTTPTTDLEPGDRFELPVATQDRVALPSYLQARPELVQQVSDPQGRLLDIRWQTAEPVLLLPEATRHDLQTADSLWLAYQGNGRFSLVPQKEPPPPIREDGESTDRVPFVLDPEDARLIHAPFRHVSVTEFDLALQAARLSTHAGFDRLLCLNLVRDMELLEHQIRTAKTVLQRFRGRALLCDEVGLGKTIEAGLVFAELRMRGLIRSALILVPPSLVEQWQGEMRRKFTLDLVSYDDPDFRAHGAAAWTDFDWVIASLHTAKREPHRSAIVARKWDLVIVDEAHHLRNRNTLVWRLVSELQKQFILLLTATPVQNNLEELYNLVTLLEPGLLRTARQFQKHFVDRKDKLTPRAERIDELHRLLAEVMVRNRRSTVGLQFTRRWARTMSVAPSPAEKELYDGVAGFVREHLRSAGGKGTLSRMALIALQMALGSSSQAAGGTLERLAETTGLAEADQQTLLDLSSKATSLTENAKASALLQILSEYPDKMVIFTQFRATQDMLYRRLVNAGHSVALFHGGLSRLAKEEAIRQFRGPARLLLATESGSEGRNLQFAHAVCNFDLPWNPMRIEQRIGRLSRIGQTQDVYVYNLVAAGTIEATVLHLLEAKLNLFELVIGEIDMILGNLEEEREFQEIVADLWADSVDLGDFKQRMEDLGNRLLEAKEAYLRERAHDDKLFGDRFTPDA
jgi:SNF2 family DNA or RNA helicase